MIQARKKLQRPKEEEIYREILKLVTTILGFAAQLPKPNTYELQTNRTTHDTVFNSKQSLTIQILDALTYQAANASSNFCLSE
jgi:hypothetical protein